MNTIKMELMEIECKRPYPPDPGESPAFPDAASYPTDYWWEEIGRHSSRFRLHMIDTGESMVHTSVESPSFFRDGRRPGEKERALHDTMHHAAMMLAKRIL